MDWNEEKCQEINGTKLRIRFVMAKHWSKRFIADTNQRLWGGFII